MAFKKIILTLPTEGYTGATVDHKLTETNLKNQPELAEAGHKAGDVIKVIPSEDGNKSVSTATPSVTGNESTQQPSGESGSGTPPEGDKEGAKPDETDDSGEIDVNAAVYKRAAEIAEKLGVESVFENDKGEFFTSKNLALLSVNQDKNRVKTYNF